MISGTFFPAAVVAVSAGWPLAACGAVTGATGELVPIVLKTDAGIFVSSLTVVASVGWKVEEFLLLAVPPLASLMMTRAATTTTTSPTASHVKRPAGRPPLAGARVGAGRFFDAGVLATVLLFK